MTKFSDEMQNHLVSFKENNQYIPPIHKNRKWEYLDITDNLYPPIRHGFLQNAYDKSISFHDYARHVRSSQIFCFNLIYPFLPKYELKDIFAEKLKLEKAERDDWFFEYHPEHIDYLGEWQGKKKPSRYITSVDFVHFLKCKNDCRVAILTEVKFTEEEFSRCGGARSPGNRNKKFCTDNFEEDLILKKCYLIKKKKRNYFELTDGVYKNLGSGICPFYQHNQCHRIHALGKALVKSRVVDEAYFGLIYHDRNLIIKQAWEDYKSLCEEKEIEYLFNIKASEIVKRSEDETYKRYFRDRYQVG